jgi:hypothetical protein
LCFLSISESGFFGVWLIYSGVPCLVAGKVWEKGKNWTFELWVFFFRFLVIGRAKAADGCFIGLFCSVGYSESVGKHFESWAFDFSRAEAAKLP